MTSQTKTIDELKAEAKELKIKGYATMKEATLKQRIFEAQQTKRRKAPSMSVTSLFVDERAELISRLDAEDPECKHLFMSGRVTDKELAAKGLERTQHQLRNDVVCRTMRDSYDKVCDDQRQFEWENMQNIDGGTGIIDAHTEEKRVPREA